MSSVPGNALDREMRKLRKALGDNSGSKYRTLEATIAERRQTGYFNEEPITTAIRNLLSRAEVTGENLDYLVERIRSKETL